MIWKQDLDSVKYSGVSNESNITHSHWTWKCCPHANIVAWSVCCNYWMIAHTIHQHNHAEDLCHLSRCHFPWSQNGVLTPRTGRTSFPGVGGGQPGLWAHQRSSGKSSGGNLGVGSQLEGACFRPQLGRTWCCACLLELAFYENSEPTWALVRKKDDNREVDILEFTTFIKCFLDHLRHFLSPRLWFSYH